MFPVSSNAFRATIAILLAGSAFTHAESPDPAAPNPVNEAAGRMTVPAGFEVALYAGEPDVVQPIALTTDERGRLWVVECLSYPTWQTNRLGQDRVVIFEDANGDGHFDRKHVFWDQGRNLSGIAVGFGGVWLCSAPELIFIPDRNGDDIPDGAPEVMLDGWSLEAKHNIVNGLNWGPDGWLYGCHGILADSKVGPPGTPPAQRSTLNCGVWRFHPTRRVFEVVAHGMTNPWGITFNEYGEAFVANCVIKHLFHIIPGGRYERMFGQDDNPYAFRLMESCADHIHWAGGFWKTEGAGGAQNDAAGGGHAHCGAMIYLGDNWPDEYRNEFFTLNVHGRRINRDTLERQGSGYVAKHRPDLLKANDAWFRGVSLVPAADGGVFMSDWSDAGECHDYDDIHRENGRIYKITFGASTNRRVDLARLSDAELTSLQLSKDDWRVSQARRLLQERAALASLSPDTRIGLVQLLRQSTDASRQLRALWALHVTGGLEPALVSELLDHPQEWVRAWTIQLALETARPSAALRAKLALLAAQDPSPLVRRYLASGLQRIPLLERVPIAGALAGHDEDAQDANLPWLIWYALEPIVSSDDKAAAALLNAARIPVVREFISERLALRLAYVPLSEQLAGSTDAGLQRDVVRGMFAALNGRRQLARPAQWTDAAARLSRHPDTEIQEKSLLLSLVFGDSAAAQQLRQAAADPARAAASRQQALQGLVQARVEGLVALLQSLVQDPQLRAVAIRGLAAFDDPGTPAIILKQYSTLNPPEKADAIMSLSSRPAYALALLEAVQKGQVPARDISPFTARQLQALKDARIPPLLAAALGQVRAVSPDKAAAIAKWKTLLTPEALGSANAARGRALFLRTCASCHTLFGEGGKIGPELTGSQRANLEYLLENVVDPNAVVSKQYQAVYFETSDDRLISGLVLRENESTLTIQTQTDTLTLPRKDITARTESSLSMMPEGLLDTLAPQEVLDLMVYLQSPSQVPMESEK